MNLSRLLRTALFSALGLLVAGGLMTVQAQTVTVDEDGGQAATEISDGLDQLNSQLGSPGTGTLRVFAGDYTDTDANVQVGGPTGTPRGNLQNVNFVVVRDQDDNADALEIEAFDLAGTNVNLESENGGFLRILTAGGVSRNVGFGSSNFDLLTRRTGGGASGVGLLEIVDSGALEFQDPDNGSGDLQIFAENGVRGEDIVFNGTDPGDIARVEYQIQGGATTAGSELGTATATDLVGELAVTEATSGPDPTLNINSSLTVGAFEHGDSNPQDVDVEVDSDFTVGSDVTVPEEGDLTVTGLFQITAPAGPKLTVNGSVNPGSDVGDFEFTQDDGKIRVANTATSPTVGDNATNGDIAFNDVTIPVNGPDPTIIRDGGAGDPGTVDISGATLTVNGGEATVRAGQASSFDILNIAGGPVDISDTDGTSDATFTVGGALRTVDLSSNGTVAEITSGTIVGGLNNSGATVQVTGPVTYDLASAGQAIDNSTSGAEIAVSGTLTIDDSGDGAQDEDALDNNGTPGVTGNGTLVFDGDDDGAGNVDFSRVRTNAGEENNLPSVTARTEVSILDAPGGRENVNISGTLTANSVSSNPSSPTVKFGAGSTGGISVSGDVTADGPIDFGTGSIVGAIDIGGTLFANADVTVAPGNNTDARVTIGAIEANGPGTLDLTNASAGSPPDVFVQNDIEVVASSAGTTLDISGVVTELQGNFDRRADGATFSDATITSTQSTELTFTGPDASEFSTGSQFTLQGLLRINKNESAVTLTESLRMDGNINIEEPGSPSPDNNRFVIDDNLFMVQNNASSTAFIADGDFITNSFLKFAGGNDYEIQRNDQVPPFIPTIGDIEVLGGSTVDVTSNTGLDFNLAFGGLIQLTNGTLDVNNGGTGGNFYSTRSPASQGSNDDQFSNPNPEIVLRLDNANFNTSGGASTFNADPGGSDPAAPALSDYNLTVRGNGDGTIQTADNQTETEEFDPVAPGNASNPEDPAVAGKVDSLTVEEDAQYGLDQDHTIDGRLFVDGPSGNGQGGIIDTDGSTSQTLTLSASDTDHRVRGAVSAFDNGFLTLTVGGTDSAGDPVGDQSDVFGSQNSSDPSIIQNFTADASEVSLTNVGHIANDLTVESSAGLSVSLRQPLGPPGSSNPSEDGKVYGAITSDGALTLGRDLVVEGNNTTTSENNAANFAGNSHTGSPSSSVDLTGGSLTFGVNDLFVEEGFFSGAASVTYSATGSYPQGTLFMNSGNTFGTNEGNPDDAVGTVPRVEFNATTTLGSESSVSDVLTFNAEVQSGSDDLVFTGTANVNLANAFTGTGFLVSAGTTVNIADNDGDDDDLTPLPSSEASSSGSGVSPQQISISNPAQFSRFRVASGSGGTTEITSPGNAALEITQILDLQSGTLDHDLNIALTGSGSFEEFQTSSPGPEPVVQGIGSTPAGTARLILNGGANFTLGLAEALTVPNLEVASEASTAASSSGELTVGDDLFLEAPLLTSNASTGLTIADLATITRTDNGTDDILDEEPTFSGKYNLTYGDGSGTDFESGRELSDAPTSDPDIRDLTVDASGGTVEFDNDELGGVVAVDNTLFLTSGVSEGERQVNMVDGSEVVRTGNHSHSSTPGRLPTFTTTGSYTVEYTGSDPVSTNPVEFTDGVIDVLTTMDGNDATINLSRDILSLEVDNLSGTTIASADLDIINSSSPAGTGNLEVLGATFDVNGSDIDVQGIADIFGATTQLTSNSAGDDSKVTVLGTTTVSDGGGGTDGVLDIGSEWQAEGDLFVENEGEVEGDLLDANANLTVDDATLDATFNLFGDLTVSGSSTTQSSVATFDGEDSQGVDMTALTSSGIELAQTTIDQTVSSNDYPRVEVEGGNVLLTGSSNAASEDVLVFDNGLLDVAEGQTPSANRVEIDSAQDGFDRSQVDFGSGNNADGDDVGHVIGTYRQNVAGQEAGVYVAPVGSDVASRPKYRRYRLIFRGTGQDEVPLRDTQLDVEHVTANPQGTEGLPVEDATGLTVGSYPQYFWRISTTEGLGSGQKAEQSVLASDLEALFDDEENLRLIRRGDGPVTGTEWRLVGDGTSYDNFGDAQTEPDNTVRIRTQETEGSFEDIGVRLTVGAPGQLPSFTAAEYDSPSSPDRTIDEGETLTARFSASSGDFNQTLTSLDTADVPQDARDFITAQNSIDGGLADTDTLTTDSLEVEFEPDNSFVTTGGGSRTVDLTVRAEDNEGTVDSTFTVTVNDDNRPPTITDALPDTTIAGGQDLDQVYDASDPDGQDVSFSLDNPPNGVDFSSATPAPDTLEWTPTFGQAGANYAITAEASDGTATVDSTSTVEVVYDRLVGDVDGSAGVPGGLFPGDPGFKDLGNSDAVRANDALRALEVAVGKSASDREIRASDCAPLVDASDPSQGCEGDDPPAADRDNVRAADAFAVLRVAVNTGGPSTSQPAALASSASKAGDASGEIQIGEPEVKEGRAALPVVLSKDASGVFSADVTLELEEGASIASVSDQLPDGWQIASHAQEDGTVKLGMFGTSALSGGKIATLQVDLGGSKVDGLEGHYRINTSGERDLKVQTTPSEFKLMGNYPNPVSQSTTIEYQLKEARPVTVEVYNTLGQKVATLVDEKKEAGTYEVTWDAASGASGLSSGVYFYRITAGDFSESKRMTIVR